MLARNIKCKFKESTLCDRKLPSWPSSSACTLIFAFFGIVLFVPFVGLFFPFVGLLVLFVGL